MNTLSASYRSTIGSLSFLYLSREPIISRIALSVRSPYVCVRPSHIIRLLSSLRFASLAIFLSARIASKQLADRIDSRNYA